MAPTSGYVLASLRDEGMPLVHVFARSEWEPSSRPIQCPRWLSWFTYEGVARLFRILSYLIWPILRRNPWCRRFFVSSILMVVETASREAAKAERNVSTLQCVIEPFPMAQGVPA